jgi:Ricin-type beta-trefoil lectin domain-like
MSAPETDSDAPDPDAPPSFLSSILLAACCLLTLLAGCASRPAVETQGGVPEGWVVIRDRNSGKLVSIPPVRNVVQWTERGTADQLWRLVEHPDGTVTLLSATDGKALTAEAQPTSAGEVFAARPDGQPTQRWRRKPQPDGTVILVSAPHGLALDVMEASREDGWIALLWHEGGAANQRWMIEPAGSGLVRLRAQHSGMLLTVTPSQDQDGADAAIWSDVGTRWQQWKLVPEGDAFRIVNRHSGRVLQLSRGRHTQTMDVEQGTFDGGTDQLWRVAPAGEGWWKFTSVKNDASFDVIVLATADGSNLWSYEFNGGDNQLFQIEPVK